MPPKPKYLATTQLIDGEPYVVPFAETGDAGVTSIVGITGTKAQFDTACTDGNFAYTTACPTIAMADGANIETTEDEGAMIATTAAQKIGFYGADPIPQPSSTGTVIGFDPNGGDPVLHDSTFTGNSGSLGYTIGDIVGHLKALGLLDT